MTLSPEILARVKEVRARDGKKPYKRKKTCNRGEIRRWLWLRWFGLPAPVRVWRRFIWVTHPKIASWPGCGCLVKAKVAWDGLKWWIKIVKQA